LWQKSFTQAMPLSRRALGEWLNTSFLHWRKSMKCQVLATNFHGDYDEEAIKYKTYPAMVHGSDPFGSHRIAELVQTIKPDLVWVTNDLWVAINLWGAVKPLRETIPFKFFVYTPIDSYGIFPDLNGPVIWQRRASQDGL
jgi:hypothetical protein